MSDKAFPCVPAATAAEVCRRFRPGRVATALLHDHLTPSQFLDLLTTRRLFKDATSFLAHALPNREAVWWAVLCVREVVGPAPPELVAAALRAAEAWVQDPSEENRRAAREAAKAAGTGSPAGLAATAAFQSGGSLGPPDGPEILPSEHATARGVANAITIASLQAPAEKAPERFPSFVARGVEVATGDNRWTEPVKTDPQPVEATDGTDPQATTDEASDPTDPATLSKRAARLQWQTDGVTGGPDPQAPAAGPTARTAPAAGSKRSARLQWD
jgi:hypothetical protein